MTDLDRIFGRVQSNLGNLNWPKDYINPQIRPLLRDRIRRFISVLVQNLNRQILFPICAGALLLLNKQPQRSIDEWDDSSSDPRPKALIYARVSSHEQVDSDEEDQEDSGSDGEYEGSIEGQIDELKELLNKHDLELAHEPLVDKAETGTNFEREGIKKVFKLAQRDEIEYLLAEKVDRIGRTAAETIYFIYILQSECNVTLITPSGERDVGEIEGLLHTTLMSLVADIENEIRTKKATKERVRNFVEKKKWSSYSNVIPVGYSETEDDWLEIDSEEAEAAKDLFAEFTDPDAHGYASYAKTKRTINERYDDILDGHRVKTLLQNPVYIGKPQIPENWVVDLPYDNVVEDQSLAIIDGATFEAAQRIINEKDQKHSTDDDANEIMDFVEQFNLFTVVASSDPVALIHDCGTPMIENGQRDLDGEVVTHTYYCRECDEYRKWPRNYEYRRMKIIHLLLDKEVDFLEALREAVSFLQD